MKFFIDGNGVGEYYFMSRLNDEVSYGIDERFDKYLDETYAPYEIGGSTLCASEILKTCMNQDYEEAKLEFLYGYFSEVLDSLERGNVETINDFMFEITED